MIALLSEIFLDWVKAACELRSMNYGSKHASQSLSDTPLCACYTHNLKTTSCIRTVYMYILNDCSTIGDAYTITELWF